MKKEIFILILLSCLLSSCKEKSLEDKIEKTHKFVSISQLVDSAYMLKEEPKFIAICKIINDSLSKSGSILLNSIVKIDDVKKNVLWRFDDYLSDVYVNDNLFFEINIRSIDSVMVENNFKNIEDIKISLKEFVTKPDSVCNCYVKSKIDFFGEINKPRVGIKIIFLKELEEEFSIEKWKLFFNTIHQVVDYYEDERNAISIEKWGKSFESLNLEKKIAVTKYVGLNIQLVLKEGIVPN